MGASFRTCSSGRKYEFTKIWWVGRNLHRVMRSGCTAEDHFGDYGHVAWKMIRKHKLLTPYLRFFIAFPYVGKREIEKLGNTGGNNFTCTYKGALIDFLAENFLQNILKLSMKNLILLFSRFFKRAVFSEKTAKNPCLGPKSLLKGRGRLTTKMNIAFFMVNEELNVFSLKNFFSKKATLKDFWVP